MSIKSRALHYVLKIGSLKDNLEFFRDKLKMSVLRHELFEEGCDAACNGPYNNRWSKTMIGYGPEDTNFVIELTYNYSVGKYRLGNDLQYIRIGMFEQQFDELKKGDDKKDASNADHNDNKLTLISPDGYKFEVTRVSKESKQDITEVCLSCRSIENSKKYWCDLLKMPLIKEEANSLLLNYNVKNNQAYLKLKQINEDIDHKSAYGRIAFSCPTEDLKGIQKCIEDANEKILTPYLKLETPGKADVVVVILSDVDGHEICFVGDEGFRELSKVDPEANKLIEQSITEDKSNEWFQKKKMMKREV